MDSRHFLFLQGLPGPSMRLIARRLEQGRYRVSRINCNGGDLADWGWTGMSYRGNCAAFGSWVSAICQKRGVTDIVLFGAERPLHRAAIAAARELMLDVHVLDEGYLRPNSVAIEFWRKGLPWQSPRSLAECTARGRDSLPEVGISNQFSHRLREAMTYGLWTVLLTPLFPRFRSHRPFSPLVEALLWVRRTIWRRAEQRSSRAALAALGEAPFFLFPLQLDGDAQLQHRSSFPGMAAAATHIMTSFARAAPGHLSLVIKRHPFDPDSLGWRRLIEAAAARLGIGARLHFVEFADLDQLLDRCLGVITVNSTVGGLALHRGKPVHVLGEALYAMPGLASQGDPDHFWSAPAPIEPGAFAQFSRALNSECLVNAGFHSRDGLTRLAVLAADRLVKPPSSSHP